MYILTESIFYIRKLKLIVWLGNPGEKYTHTRHNVGFMFIDFFSRNNSFSQFSYESKFKADISEWTLSGEKILLVKPQTFMNLSGESLQKICQFYKLESSDFLIVYDDKDMDFWKVRVRDTGSAGGHNGVKDIIRFFWNDWKRIKIWVWKNENFDTADWVLSKFSEEELIDLENEVFSRTEEELKKNI